MADKRRWDYVQLVDRRTGRRVLEHRAVAEEELGRRLYPWEVVHHINGDTLDNRPVNLAVLTSQRAHMFLHHYQWREEAGVGHIFSLEEMLHGYGEDVLWLADLSPVVAEDSSVTDDINYLDNRDFYGFPDLNFLDPNAFRVSLEK